MERAEERPPDVARAAVRLHRLRARICLAAKRGIDVVVALAMLIALLPLIVLVALLLLAEDEDWLEQRVPVGRALERAGARELPLLLSVVGGGLSLVGPRPLPPGGDGYTGPRRLMAPGLVGPAQRWAMDAATASQLDDAYVEDWSLRRDLKLLACGHRRFALPARR
jgi:lipopolysaccharide/colanic/teichoic acid biosynthesis glycosyltransferase